MNVGEEVERLKVEIKRLGALQDDGSYKVTTHFNSIYQSIHLFPFIYIQIQQIDVDLV